MAPLRWRKERYARNMAGKCALFSFCLFSSWAHLQKAKQTGGGCVPRPFRICTQVYAVSSQLVPVRADSAHSGPIPVGRGATYVTLPEALGKVT